MPETTATLSYTRLREAILSIELRPGETLTEARLCVLLETSRTTVRGALARLENEGLVRKDGRSYRVSSIDAGEIQHAFQFREVLEVGALRAALPAVTPAQLSWVRARVCDFDDASTMDVYMHRATRFHTDLAALAGNPFLVRALEDVLLRLARARWLEAWGREGRDRSHADHLSLLDLMAAGDAEAACGQIQAHLHRSCTRLVTLLGEERQTAQLRRLATVL
jgi:DNA-binding GntR family transcriptional regulator